MTVPPGGPYGQDPYGQNPYGTNPYGQQPYWGEQPQGQPPGQPGGPYPYQSGAQYGPPAGDPYAGYPPQQFPPGQQAQPGWTGNYPPGPPPGGSSSKTPWLIVSGIAVLGVIVLVVILVVSLNNKDSNNTAAPSSSTSAATSAAPENTEQTATDCTGNVSGGTKPAGDTVSAGKLSFPVSAAPGWAPFIDDQSPNLIGAVGLGQEVPGANQWMMQVEVAVTNFVTSMDVGAQASKLMDCVVKGPGYSQATPTPGPKKTSSITVDGVKAARVDSDIAIADAARGLKGDTLTIIAVDTKPVTIFMAATPIGDAPSLDIANKVIAALKVSKSN